MPGQHVLLLMFASQLLTVCVGAPCLPADHRCPILHSEVPGSTGHVQNPQDSPQECTGPQGPHPAVPRWQGRVHPLTCPWSPIWNGRHHMLYKKLLQHVILLTLRIWRLRWNSQLISARDQAWHVDELKEHTHSKTPHFPYSFMVKQTL